MSNFIPHETFICDDGDTLWINTWTKNPINNKNILYKKHLRRGKNLLKECKLLQNKIINLKNDSIDIYYTGISKQFNNPQVPPKAYISEKCFWIIETLIIPPLFYENRFVTDFTEKVELFNSFFATQCTVINFDSNVLFELLLKTDRFFKRFLAMTS